ncbi:hypothetical protein LPJ56_004533 [Coemansia sp. RSA 2599]|nr:hypothetical protein LPJ75_004384 [Coemansia sp. RSA 2598]KAJ1815560.1 hypothetical protein LPJ56_004533 [Coemansia sp. RSA 2599]
MDANNAVLVDIDRLPSLVLLRIISHSDPLVWRALGSRRLREIIDTTSFRCAWACQLANKAGIPERIAEAADIVSICDQVLQPIDELTGSGAWLSDGFAQALKAHRPRLFNALAPAMLWRSLLSENRSTAAIAAQAPTARPAALGGKVIRELLERQPSLLVLEWLEKGSVDFSELCYRDHCIDMALLTKWVLDNRTDLLEFLARHGVQLPVRSLLDYSLSASAPETVEFLMSHGTRHRDAPSWNDLLLMACTEVSTRVDVFEMIVRKTQPSIVWTFAASCLASQAMLDDRAYQKFSMMRGLPEAASWMIRSVRGRTPIQRLCDRLTYENLTYLSPFIRDYIDLGVSTADMPSIMAMLCQ